MTYVCLWIPDSSIVAARAAELEADLLKLAPRVAVEGGACPERSRGGVVWVDARGLARKGGEAAVAEALLRRLDALGVADARAGVAAVPVVAEVAARRPAAVADPPSPEPEAPPAPRPVFAVPKSYSARAAGGGAGSSSSSRSKDAAGPAPSRVAGSPPESNSAHRTGRIHSKSGRPDRPATPPADRVVVVAPGTERAFLAPLPVSSLGPAREIVELLDGVGLRRCGELAALTQEEVEMRFGPDGVALWRLARAEDARRLFLPVLPERPHASIDFIDYVVTDPERLVFTTNALLGSVCGALGGRGEHARRITLTLSLADGQTWRRTLKPARPTSSRERWLRLARAALERLELPDAVAGVAVQVEATQMAGAVQGDLFDRGFATAGAVEATVARLVDEQGEVVVEPEAGAHPLLERRTRWRAVRPEEAVSRRGGGSRSAMDAPRDRSHLEVGGGPHHPAGADAPALTLQLLPEPRPVEVEALARRDHAVPTRYHDGARWRTLVTAAGPDRVSGGRWEEEPYAREYFRCVTSEGVPVWLFCDAKRDAWFLHGWWD